MSIVDEAVKAGARALAECQPGYEHGASREVIKAAWPVLSAGLREMHTRWDQGGGWVVCMHCNDNTSPPRKKQWPCETITALDRIDQELGIGDDHQSGDPS